MRTTLPASRPVTRLAALVAAVLAAAACARIAGLEEHHLEQPGQDAAFEAAAEAGADAGDEDSALVDASDVAVDVADVSSEEPWDAAADTAPEAPPDAAPAKRTATLQWNTDDALWIGCNTEPSDEKLFFEPGNRAIFVSDDEDEQCAGLRFRLEDVPAGAKIVSARLNLVRTSGDILPEDTLLVRVWDSSSVPPFDDSHTEIAASHDPAGLRTDSVGGWKPGTVDGPVSTPDLSALLQAIVDRADWASDDQHRYIGLLLLPEAMPIRWIGFADSSGALPAATLDYEWTE